MHWDSWWHAGGMWLIWLVVIAVISVAIYLAARAMTRSEPPRESPEEILKKRFARGDIDREQYEQAMKDLRQF